MTGRAYATFAVSKRQTRDPSADLTLVCHLKTANEGGGR